MGPFAMTMIALTAFGATVATAQADPQLASTNRVCVPTSLLDLVGISPLRI